MERTPRLLSFSEIDTALTCWARWDFAYGGRLADSTLKPKTLAPVLSDGRAWGAAVAAWHANSGSLLASWYAHQALRASLDRDAAAMTEFGVPPGAEQRVEAENRLSAILDHYVATTEPLANLTQLEGEIVVPVPARSGSGRGSTRYRFQCFLDGYTDDAGQQWIVEFKLRGGLTPPALIDRQRQPRWYAWAAARSGLRPLGVIVDERLNEAPKEPRTVQGRKKDQARVPSHAKDQLCTAEAYIDLCHEHGEDPHAEVVDALRGRHWQQRHPLMFRAGELAMAGDELRDAAKLIRDLDSGELAPIRNASRTHCPGCKFREVCAEPSDALFVESLFTRTVPKRLRSREQPETASAHPAPATCQLSNTAI